MTPGRRLDGKAAAQIEGTDQMGYNLRNRSFVKLLDFSPREIRFLLDLSRDLKRAKYGGYERQHMSGKNIAVIFEKTSTRTRVSFEVAAYDQGAHVTYLDPEGSQIGHKESVKDTARVLGRIYDGIEFRGFGQDDRRGPGEVRRGPGLQRPDRRVASDADARRLPHDARVQRQAATTTSRTATWATARNNMGDSLLVGGAQMGMDVRLCGPKDLWPDEESSQSRKAIAKETGARVTLTDDPAVGGEGRRLRATPTCGSRWARTRTVWDERVKLLKPYQVNAALLEKTGNPKVKFMHCLPAFHDRNTMVGRGDVRAHRA